MPSNKDPQSLVQPSDGGGAPGTSFGGLGVGTLLWGPGPNWADGSTNPATTLSGEVSKIILDLSSLTSGTAKLGGAALVGANDTIASGTLFSQLGFLKQAAHIEYAGGGNWADGTTNPASLVQAQLSKIVSDLSSLTGGTAKLGGAALVGANDTIASGTLFSQLGLLKQAAHIEYAGGGAWADATTNPATLVSLQLTKIVSDLSGSTGTAKLGGAALVGTSDTITAGTLFFQLGALKQASHIEFAAGGSWAGGTSPTNPATTVQLQLVKILTDLSAETSGASGADRLGAGSLVGVSSTIVAGTVFASLTALKSAANIDKAAGPAWLDGVANPANRLSLYIDNFISALGGVSGSSGSKKIGYSNTLSGIAANDVQDAIDAFTITTLSNDGALLVGAAVQGSFVTNSVRGQLNELDNTRAKLAGATFTGQVNFTNGLWPGLAGFGTVTKRLAMTIVGMGTSTSALISWSDSPSGAPAVDTKAGASAVDAFLLDLSGIPDGASLTSITVSTIGLSDGAATILPKYQIQSYGSSLINALSLLTPDSHTYPGNFTSAIVSTTISVSGSVTIDKTATQYFLKVYIPYDPGSGAQMRIYTLACAYTLSTLKV